jgi:hypothetical protein
MDEVTSYIRSLRKVLPGYSLFEFGLYGLETHSFFVTGTHLELT